MALSVAMAPGRCGNHMINSIPRIQTTNREINQLQQNVAQAVTPLLQNPISSGSVVTNQNLSVGNNQVAHGLGRQAQGRAIIYQSAASNIYDYQQPDNNFFYLNASVAVTVSLYVF